MKVIIAGSRSCTMGDLVFEAIRASGFTITEVVSGAAKGVDRIGEIWAEANDIPVKLFPAEWDKHGKAAGPKRNGQMADYADALIAVLFPGSKGTLNMIETAKRAGLKVFVRELVVKDSFFNVK